MDAIFLMYGLESGNCLTTMFDQSLQNVVTLTVRTLLLNSFVVTAV